MPSAPYAKVLVRIAGGATQSGGITVTAGQSVALEGENTTGWRVSQWEIIGPPGWSVPAGWTDVGGVATYIGTTGNPPSWTLPAIGGWGKWMIRLTVNGGEKDGDAAHPEMVDTTTGLSMLSALGLVDIGAGEDSQFSGVVKSWAGSTQTSLRAVDTSLTSLQSQIDALVIGGTTDATTTVKYTETIAIGDVLCSAQDAADATKVRRATAANLATGALVMGVALQAGINGDSKLMARDGCILAAATLGLGASATDTTVVLNTTTALANSTTTPAPTQRLLGKKDTQGNVTIKIVHPGIGTWIDNLSLVSPLDYGAVGDGSTDNVTAFTNAMNDAISLGKELIVPAGTFAFASTFTFSSTLPHLRVVGKLKPASTISVTIACPHTLPDRECFTNAMTSAVGVVVAGHGKIVITGTGSPLKAVHWGAKQDVSSWQATVNGLQAAAGSANVTSAVSGFTSAMASEGRVIVIAGGANANYDMSNRDSGVSLRSGSFVGIAQSFVGVSAEALYNVRLMLKKTGAPTGNATVKIYAHDGGSFGSTGLPTGTAFAQATVSVSALTTSYVETTISFRGPGGNECAGAMPFTDGTNYFVAIEYSGGSVGNTLDVGTDASAPTAAGNCATLTGSTWTADGTQDMVFVVDNRARHVTTVSVFNSATSINVAVAPTCDATNALGYVGTDDTRAWESALACSKGGGNATSRFVHGLAQSTSLVTSGLFIGVRAKLKGNFCTILAGAKFDRGLLTKNDLAATNLNSSSDDYIGEINLACNGLAGRGLELAKDGTVSGYAGIGGCAIMRNINVSGVRIVGYDLEGCQSTSFTLCNASGGGGGGFRVIGCNGTSFNKCVVNNLNGGDGWEIDGQSDIGSGGCQLNGCQAETCYGHGFNFKQSHSPSPVTVKAGWSEGNAKSAYRVDRDQVGIEDITFAGGGTSTDGGTYYPFHILANRKMIRIRNTACGGFANMYIRAETGSATLDISKNYVATSASLLPVQHADASKLAHTDRFYAIDWQTDVAPGTSTIRTGFKGTVGVNTPHGREALDVWTGSARVGHGNLTNDNGAISTDVGGFGRIENLFQNSADMTQSTGWNSGRGADTFCIAALVDPFDGETYQVYAAITGAAATNRFIWQQPNINTLKGYSSIHGRSWMWAVEGAKSAVLGHDHAYADSAVPLNSGGFTKLSQSFVAETGATITKAQFRVRKRGAPTGNVTATLYAHSGTMGTSSVPTGAALATSSNFDIATLCQADECGLAASNRDGWSPVGNGTVTKVSQSFTARGSTVIERLSIQLKKTLAPTGNATAVIYAHTGTLGTSSTPTGAALATSDNFDVSTVSTSEGTHEFKFTGANKIALSAGTNYCVSIEYSAGDASNYLEVGHDATPANAAPWGAGNLATYNGAWTADSAKDVTGTLIFDFEPATFTFPSTSQALLTVDTNYCVAIEYSGGSSTAYLEVAVDATQQTTTFTAATTDIITPAATVPHGTRGQASTTTTLPAGLSAATDYWPFWSSTAGGANAILKLASSQANQLVGTAVDITSTGAGTHTFTWGHAGNLSKYNGAWTATANQSVCFWLQPHGSQARVNMAASNGAGFLTGADTTFGDRPESFYFVGDATVASNNQSPLLRASFTTAAAGPKFKLQFKRVGLSEVFAGEPRTVGVIPTTYSTARVGNAGTGNVNVHTPPPIPGGQFTCSAAATTTVTDKRITATTKVICFPANLAAATLMLGTKSGYHDYAANVAGTSFAFKTQDATSAAGTELFNYILVEPWAN